MCAWVKHIALRLASVRHGLYLHLRAGFDRLHPVFTFIESHSFRHVPGVHELSCIKSANHPERGSTIAAVYSQGRQP